MEAMAVLVLRRMNRRQVLSASVLGNEYRARNKKPHHHYQSSPGYDGHNLQQFVETAALIDKVDDGRMVVMSMGGVIKGFGGLAMRFIFLGHRLLQF
jgi:hypothetical protein